ncbi:MAG: hypothetical protein WBQ45_16725 [Roseiarcus sp.]
MRNLLRQALYIDPPLSTETFSFLTHLGERRKYTYAIVAQMVPHFVNSLERDQRAAREMLVTLDSNHAPGGRRLTGSQPVRQLNIDPAAVGADSENRFP